MPIKQFLHHLNRRDTQILPQIRLSHFFKLCLVFLVLFSSIYLVKTIKAQNVLEQVQKAQEKGGNAESWHKNALETTAATLTTSLTGKLEFDSTGNLKQGYIPSGAIGMITNLTSSLYTPPASGIEYIAELKDNFFGINKPAYAQSNGTGFNGLQPILPLWRGFRNIVYILSSLVFVVIGLLIMLRIKISPQAVINIQNSIPQIVTTLILVTFSYAIAGLLIDISNLFQTLCVAILFQNYAPDGLGSASLFHGAGINFSFSELSNPGFWSTFWLMNKAAPFRYILLLAAVVGGIVTGIVAAIAGAGVTVAALPLVPAAIPVVAQIGGLAFIVILLVFVVLIFIWVIKFFFGLIKVYISLIIRIILGPLEIGMGAFPNSKIGFSSWLISVISDLAVFPISILFLVLSNILIETVDSGLWRPSLIGFIPSINIVGAGIGFATILMLSKLPELIPQFVFQLKPSPLGSAIGETYKETTNSSVARFGRHYGMETGAAAIEKAYGKPDGKGNKLIKAAHYGVQALTDAGYIGQNSHHK